MIKTRRLKNVVIFLQTILSFVLSRKIIVVLLFLTFNLFFSQKACSKLFKEIKIQ